MSFSGLLYRVILLVLCGHNLVQMDLIIQVIVILQTSKWLQHLLYLASKVLHERLILNSELSLGKALILLCDTLLFLINDGLEDTAFIVFGLDFLCFEINNLPQLIHTVTPRQNFPQNFTCQLLQCVFQTLNWQICGL